MLTGKLVRVRYSKDQVIPRYIDPAEVTWLDLAQQLRTVFVNAHGRTRGDIESELRETFENDPLQLVQQGLAKLLEDRCEFQVASERPPEEWREAVFLEAARQRQEMTNVRQDPPVRFDRTQVLQRVAVALDTTTELLDMALFADLKSEQRLSRFEDISAERLLDRYNVALAQAIVLRSTKVEVNVRGESPARFRQLLRAVKFHRLVCDSGGRSAIRLSLDGPLSLFTSTQKYGVQLANFLPHVLLCRDFDLRADLRWGPERKPKRFTLSSEDGLVSHVPDTGTYVPPELAMFAELFRKKVVDWELLDDPEIVPLGESHWVPDFRLQHRATGYQVYLEVLGFWRRASAERHLARLRAFVKEPFLLAVSDRLCLDDAELDALPAGVHRFRQMPLPEEIARLASHFLP